MNNVDPRKRVTIQGESKCQDLFKNVGSGNQL